MKTIITMMLVASMVFGLTGCDKKTLETAKASSAKFATYANTGVEVTRSLFRQELISIAAKDRIADAFISLADAGMAFDLAVSKAQREYGTNVPKAEIDRIFTMFDSQVVGKFLEVLASLKLISQTDVYAAVIDSLRSSIIIIAKAFGRQKQIEVRL